MPWLELRPSGVYHVVFRFGGQKFKRSLKTRRKPQAESACARLEDNLHLLERGLLDVPAGVDLAEYLLTDGKSHARNKLPPSTPLGQLFEEYLQNIPPDSLEEQTIYVANIHIRHFKKVLGRHVSLHRLTEADLQHYVLSRTRQKGRHGRPISTVTVKKELATLRTVWNWARQRGHVTTDFPSRNLRFPKTSDQPVFQTRRQIERQIVRGGLARADEEQLWRALFLTVPETEQLLDFIETHSRYDFLYPMAVMAAHTGARRSELCRSCVSDFDLDGGTVTIREQKRVKGRRTTRQVTLSPRLERVMRRWLDAKQPSIHMFPRNQRLTLATKNGVSQEAVSAKEASRYLIFTLADSEWNKVRGWHIFRHSFCSNCAAAGIDQRVINAWVGHQTEEMVRRYRHLIPDHQRAAIQAVFGGHS